MRWQETLVAYNFKIYYVRGTENARVDVLSRRPNYYIDRDLEDRILKRYKPDQTKLIQDFADYYFYNKPEIQEARERVQNKDKAYSISTNNRVYYNNILLKPDKEEELLIEL